jgi:hypothetical protein
VGATFIACSQESNKYISRNYHNMAARYNCYFLARERMSLIDNKIIANHKDNYNYILPFFPYIDTNFTKGMKSDLDYVFDKARITFDKHKNSNWLAESYNIIGKSKWYASKVDTAIYVHKYVLAKTDDNPGRQMAQISLLRIYVFQNDFTQADEEFIALKKQKIFPENLKGYNEACIEYLYIQREFTKMLPYLESTLTLEKKKDRRSRLHFIIAQIHQRNGNSEEAYKHYKKSLKRNPPYEIEFNAKLNLSQVSNVNSKEQQKKIEKTFEKMLEDDKNKDYLSRIYYEKGRYELKRGNISNAVIYLNNSIEAPNTTKEQKAYPYLLLGKLHFEVIDTMPSIVDKYSTAKLYYDSTVSSMDIYFEGAEDVKERQKILVEFVKQLTIVDDEERAQKWATLSPEELKIEVDKKIKLDNEKLERELAKEKRKAELAERNKPEINTLDNISAPGGLGTKTFYAYDQNTLATQKQKFEQVWGLIPLEDNWRRSNKEFVDLPTVKTTTDTNKTSVPDDSLALNDILVKDEGIKTDTAQYTANLPTTSEEIAESNNKLHEALYELGKIYYYDLVVLPKAQESFEKYLNKFSGYSHEAEVIYFLYLISERTKDGKSAQYKNLERQKYPNSIFMKLMDNENYLTENESDNKISHELYEQAFNLYKANQFTACAQTLENLKTSHPKSDITDQITFLNILTYAQTDQIARYYTELEQFVKDFGTSPLKTRALEIIAAKPKNLDLNTTKDKNYYRNDSVPHYFLAVFKYNQMPSDQIDRIYKEFRGNYYKDILLTTKIIEFSSDSYLYVNKSFANFESAKAYYDKLMKYHEFGEHLDKIDYSYYLVTEENYTKLLTSKNINDFKEFYQKQYGIKK